MVKTTSLLVSACALSANAFVPVSKPACSVSLNAPSPMVVLAGAGGEEPSRVSRVLNKVSFGLLGNRKPEAPERPTLFQESAATRLDGAKYEDDFEAMMDDSSLSRPKRVELGEPKIEGAEAEAEEGGTAVKELKKSRELMASDADIEKTNRLFGLKQ